MSFIYYAHFVGDYNTKTELDDMKLIEKLFPNSTIFNPNSEYHSEQYKKIGMEYFYDIVRNCDVLVFRGLYNGKITAGVYGEIKTAEQCNIPIIEFSSNYDNRNLTVEQTRDILKLSL